MSEVSQFEIQDEVLTPRGRPKSHILAVAGAAAQEGPLGATKDAEKESGCALRSLAFRLPNVTDMEFSPVILRCLESISNGEQSLIGGATCDQKTMESISQNILDFVKVLTDSSLCVILPVVSHVLGADPYIYFSDKKGSESEDDNQLELVPLEFLFGLTVEKIHDDIQDTIQKMAREPSVLASFLIAEVVYQINCVIAQAMGKETPKISSDTEYIRTKAANQMVQTMCDLMSRFMVSQVSSRPGSPVKGENKESNVQVLNACMRKGLLDICSLYLKEKVEEIETGVETSETSLVEEITLDDASSVSSTENFFEDTAKFHDTPVSTEIPDSNVAPDISELGLAEEVERQTEAGEKTPDTIVADESDEDTVTLGDDSSTTSESSTESFLAKPGAIPGTPFTKEWPVCKKAPIVREIIIDMDDISVNGMDITKSMSDSVAEPVEEISQITPPPPPSPPAPPAERIKKDRVSMLRLFSCCMSRKKRYIISEAAAFEKYGARAICEPSRERLTKKQPLKPSLMRRIIATFTRKHC